jgi:hypothetical protein
LPKLRLIRFRPLTLAIILSAALIFAGYGWWSASYYPFDVFAGLTASSSRGGRAIVVSGHVMGSFYCVGPLDHRERQGELNVRMRYRLMCSGQRSGSFSIEIPLAGKVDRVTYGDERIRLPGLR